MIVVLGASGNIGSATVEELKRKGARFKAGFRSAEELQTAKSRGIDAVQADYGDVTSLVRAFDGAERVFFVSNASPDLLPYETNVLNAAKQTGIKLLVKGSVWGCEEEAFIFAHKHRKSEEQIESSGVPYTFIRPNGFFQNVLQQAGLVQAQGMIVQPDIDPAVSEVDVRDIGAVVAAVLTGEGHEGKGYKVGGPEAITGAQKAEALSEVLGRPVRCQVIPGTEWKKAALAQGVPEWLADGVIDLTRYYGEGRAAQIVDTLPKLTGRQARSFRQFAEDFADAFRSEQRATA